MFNNIDLYYWATASSSEIDFIIYNEEGIIPIEVKASVAMEMIIYGKMVKMSNRNSRISTIRSCVYN